MKSALSKRIPRNLAANFIKYLGIIIILVCTITIGSSSQSTMNAAVKYLDNIEVENMLEDGQFETSMPMTEEAFKFFEDEKIAVCENFYALENEYNGDCKVNIFGPRDELNIPTLFDGKMPESKDEIALDHVFSRSNGIVIGDTIELCKRKFTVCGTVSFPDYSSLFMNNTDLVMNTKHFGVAIVSEETFEAIDSSFVNYRYSYRFDQRDLDKATKVSKAEDMMRNLLLTGNSLQSFLRADQNQSISFLREDIGSDGPMVAVFVYILVALIAFIFAILTNSSIEKEAVVIGTLRALGYTRGEIIWHYMQPTIIISIIGSVVGNLIGYTVMLEPFFEIYYTSYSVGPLVAEFDVKTFCITTIVPVVLMLLINFLMLYKKLKLSPLKFLRRELKSGKARRAVKLPNISFINRFRLRVIIKNRGCYIMLFLGIFLSSFLLMFGIGLNPLMKHYTDTIDESLNYEYQYILKAPVDESEGEKIYVYEMDTWFELGKKNVGVSIYGIDEDSKFFKDAYLKEGVSVSSALAAKLGIKEGDTLKLNDDLKDREFEFTVKKIYDFDAMLGMFIDKESLIKLLDVESGSYNSIISNEKLDIDEAFVAKRIARQDVLGASMQMMRSFDTVILFVNIFAVAVYLVMMYILTKVVIDKNAISISYMKVFGYEGKEIGKIYLTASAIVVGISLFVCIPLEVQLFKVLLVWISAMIEGYLEFYLPFDVYVKIVVIGIVTYLVVNLIHLIDVNKIPMTDALKNRE